MVIDVSCLAPPSRQVVLTTGWWNYNSNSGANPKKARVLVIWKRYPKAGCFAYSYAGSIHDQAFN